MNDQYSVKIYQEGLLVAQVFSNSPAAALEEGARYARSYEQDGPVTIKIKNPKKVKHDD